MTGAGASGSEAAARSSQTRSLRRDRPSLISLATQLARRKGGAGFHESGVPNGRLRVPRHLLAKPLSGRLSGLSSMATRHILADLARDYEARKGTHVEIRSMGGVEAAKLVRAGEATDVVVLASKVMASLEAEGHLAKGSSKGLRAVGDRHCRPRGLATAEHCKRTSGQTGHAGCAKDLLLDRSRAAIT